MVNNLELLIVESESDVIIFWQLFDSYVNELSLNTSLGDEFDLDYFCSDEYRGTIDKLRVRNKNKLKIFLINKKEVVIGFLMYVTYFDEAGKCFLMEYYIEPNCRGLGYGKLAYLKAEKYINNEGASYIELTPTNRRNEKFWNSIGFRKSMDMDEDNKYYYRKSMEEKL